MQPISMAGYFDTMSQSQKLYNRHLEPVCRKWDMTRNELDVLLFLYNNPEYDRAADVVAHRGMLQRVFSPQDRRTAHLKLTDAGILVASEGREAQKAFFFRLYEGIAPEEMALWREITEKVRDNIRNFEKL